MVDLYDGLATLVLLAGAGLVIVEAFVPGGAFIVLGVSLLAAGLVGVLAPLEGIGLVFAMAGAAIVSGLLSLVGYREYDIYGGGETASTSDVDSLRGSTGRVTERVTETGGEVKLDDGGFNPYYRAKTIEGAVSEGERVIVVDPGGGNVVTVESMAAIDDIDRALDAEMAASEGPGESRTASERDARPE